MCGPLPSSDIPAQHRRPRSSARDRGKERSETCQFTEDVGEVKGPRARPLHGASRSGAASSNGVGRAVRGAPAHQEAPRSRSPCASHAGDGATRRGEAAPSSLALSSGAPTRSHAQRRRAWARGGGHRGRSISHGGAPRRVEPIEAVESDRRAKDETSRRRRQSAPSQAERGGLFGWRKTGGLMCKGRHRGRKRRGLDASCGESAVNPAEPEHDAPHGQIAAWRQPRSFAGCANQAPKANRPDLRRDRGDSNSSCQARVTTGAATTSG